jgi:hypothetical protein
LTRVRQWLIGGLALALASASISWTLPTTITIADDQGRPASGAYVRFHYTSNVLNFVHPIRHLVRGSVIVKADAEGRVRVPFRIHFRRPLPLMTSASLSIDDIVVPHLHNAFGPIAAGVTRPGTFEVDGSRARVTVFDVSGNPELWDRSLQQLYECIWQTVSGTLAPAAPDDGRTRAHVRELIDHLRRDYRALLDAHGQQADSNSMWRGKLKQLDGLEAKTSPDRRR